MTSSPTPPDRESRVASVLNRARELSDELREIIEELGRVCRNDLEEKKSG